MLLIARFKEFVYKKYLFISINIREIFRWRRIENLNKEISIYYGHDNIPKPGDKTSGGIVKCQDLDRVYPNSVSGANILYLVSSALPPLPEIMVKNAKRQGVKVVVNQNGVAIPAYHGKNLEKINGPRRFLLKHADHVIYQSEYCKRSADKYLTTDIDSFSIILNPVNTKQYPRKSGTNKAKIPTLLLAGSHGRFYRVKAAIDVVRKLNEIGTDVQLKIIGRLAWGNDSKACLTELNSYCDANHIANKVMVSGSYSQSEAPELYRSADILIHTQYNDACPRVVVEAMSSGLPVVYSDSGGVPELVGKKAGIGVSVPCDWENIHVPDCLAMAQAVVTILNDYEIYSTHAHERACVELDVDSWLQKHKIIFAKVKDGSI